MDKRVKTSPTADKAGSRGQMAFTPIEQRVLYQIHVSLFNGLRSWVNQIDRASEEATSMIQNRADFAYASQNLFAAQVLWKIFGQSEYRQDEKKAWLMETFPLLFGNGGGIWGFVLSESAFQTTEDRPIRRKTNRLSDKLVDSYFDELRRFLKILDPKVIDDLMS